MQLWLGYYNWAVPGKSNVAVCINLAYLITKYGTALKVELTLYDSNYYCRVYFFDNVVLVFKLCIYARKNVKFYWKRATKLHHHTFDITVTHRQSQWSKTFQRSIWRTVLVIFAPNLVKSMARHWQPIKY